jgi:hypothetical protein
LACSIQTRLPSACRNWATSTSRTASSTPVLTSSAVTTASAPSASTSVGVQARGWVAYTSRVPTGWLASRTGTLSTPHTRSWATTAASRSHTRSLRKSSTATTRSSAKAARHGPSPKSCWTCSSSSIAASDTATHRGRPSSCAKVRPVPSTPTTVLVASVTRCNPANRSPARGRVARSSATVRATSCPSTAIQDPSSSELTQRLSLAVDGHMP